MKFVLFALMRGIGLLLLAISLTGCESEQWQRAAAQNKNWFETDNGYYWEMLNPKAQFPYD
jgi:hypothetical protein